jgi:hypothetical protein
VLPAIIPADRGTTEPIKAGFLDGTAIAAQIGDGERLAGVAGALATPDTTDLPAGVSGTPLRAFADLFYFRIWPIPAVLDVQNPKRNTPVPFKLWNAFLTANTLNVITPTDLPDITLDVAPGLVFTRLALQTVNAQIGDDAPINIDGNFDFAFDFSDTALRFIAILADILPIQADGSIVETLEWKTDILDNYDGSENRIAVRPRPRRSFSMTLLIGDDAERKTLYDKLFKTAALTVIAPSYQYQSRLKVATVPADNKLYTNVRRADLRVGENVLIATKAGEFFLYEVAAVFADHVTVTTAFSQVIDKGAIVCGAFAGRFPNKTGLQMAARGGHCNITVTMVDARAQVAWPDNGVAVPTFNGKPLLLRNPLADGNTSEAFDVGLDVIDNESGKPSFFSSWTQAFVEGARQYLIQSLLDQDDLEFWRNFLDEVKGSQKSFYTPTYREDLIRFEGTNFLPGEITVVGTEYAAQYADLPPYAQLELVTSAGTFHVKVSNAENLGDRSRIHFVDPIEVDISDAEVTRISYLMLCRLGTDVVKLTHTADHTNVDLSLRMANR